MSNQEENSNVVKYVPREAKNFIKGTPDFQVPPFVKTAMLVGLTAFVTHLAKELNKISGE